MKQCNKCKEFKQLTGFFRNKRRKDGRSGSCKVCSTETTKKWYEKNKDRLAATSRVWYLKNKAKVLEYNKKWAKKNEIKYKLLIRNANYKRKYGIGIKDYEEMLIKQKNRCVICGKKETSRWRGTLRSLSIDHCHKTGKVRGLLCQRCNDVLGKVRDDIAILTKMIEYLRWRFRNG